VARCGWGAGTQQWALGGGGGGGGGGGVWYNGNGKCTNAVCVRGEQVWRGSAKARVVKARGVV